MPSRPGRPGSAAPLRALDALRLGSAARDVLLAQSRDNCAAAIGATAGRQAVEPIRGALVVEPPAVQPNAAPFMAHWHPCRDPDRSPAPVHRRSSPASWPLPVVPRRRL